MRNRRWAALALAAGMAAWPAAAETVGWRYEIYWGGFRAGELAMTREETGAAFRADMAIRTVGLFDDFLRLRFAAESSGRAAPEVVPGHYQTHYTNRREERLLRVEFDPRTGRGATTLDRVLAVFAPPTEDDEPAPPVPDELRHGALDPLSNVVVIGRRAVEALAGHGPRSFRTASYDGKRRYDFDVTVKGRETIRIGERSFDTIALTMVLTPMAGFRPRFQRMWEGAEYQVHLDPATLLPMRIATASFAAPTVINVVEACRVPAAECRPQVAATR